MVAVAISIRFFKFTDNWVDNLNASFCIFALVLILVNPFGMLLLYYIKVELAIPLPELDDLMTLHELRNIYQTCDIEWI